MIARGKIARSPEAELVARYEKRIAWPVRLTELPESGGRIPDPLTPFRTVLLDEKGKDLSSEQLAAMLEQWRDGGMRECRFVIGAADGHTQAERDDFSAGDQRIRELSPRSRERADRKSVV